MQVKDITDYLIFCLEEINKAPKRNEFIVGEIYALIDCLEFILSATISQDELLKLEQKYGII